MDIGITEGTQVDPELYGNTVAEAGGGAMGKDQFLQLLITEMQNQDPLDPVDNKEMVAQLAQFSALEQMQNLNTNFEKYQENTTAAISSLLVGKTGAAETGTSSVYGKITQVVQDGDTIKVKINGQTFELANVKEIFE